MGKPGITLADISGRSASFRAANPQLFGAQAAPKAPAAPPGGDSGPPKPSKAIRGRKTARTRPESQMEALLAKQQGAGEIACFGFEEITLTIGEGVRYTPDFFIILPCGKVRLVEVKGPFIREDGLIKFKVAKHKYQCFEWELWQLSKTGWARLL